MSSDQRRWPELIPACAVAGTAATFYFGLSPRAAVPLAAGNVAEATLGAWMLRRFCPACADLKSLGEIGFDGCWMKGAGHVSFSQGHLLEPPIPALQHQAGKVIFATNPDGLRPARVVSDR